MVKPLEKRLAIQIKKCHWNCSLHFKCEHANMAQTTYTWETTLTRGKWVPIMNIIWTVLYTMEWLANIYTIQRTQFWGNLWHVNSTKVDSSTLQHQKVILWFADVIYLFTNLCICISRINLNSTGKKSGLTTQDFA
jgi:hypothetical protein